MTTEQQALDSIEMLEEGIQKEVYSLGLERENTSSYLLQQYAKKYIDKINSEYVEEEDYFLDMEAQDHITLKRDYFNFKYSIKYLAHSELYCSEYDVRNSLEIEYLTTDLVDLIPQQKLFHENSIKSSNSLPIKGQDTPNGIKTRIIGRIVLIKLDQLRDFALEGNRLMNKSIEENQSYVKKKLIKNLKTIEEIQISSSDNLVILNWINIIENEYKALLKWFPELKSII